MDRGQKSCKGMLPGIFCKGRERGSGRCSADKFELKKSLETYHQLLIRNYQVRKILEILSETFIIL